jgi:hypothetical protein
VSRVPETFKLAIDTVTLVDGYTTTESASFSTIEATTYTEQTSNAQRSLVSDSADDAAAGDGARKVVITYFDETLAGPFTETVTLNGTTAVDTVGTNIAFIERLDVSEVGAQLGNLGTVTLKAATSGGGASVGSIAPGDNETNWVHHYVASGRAMKILSVYAHIKGIIGGEVHLRTGTPTVANTPEKTIAPVLRVPPGSQSTLEIPAPLSVIGPARVTLYAKPANSVSTNWLAGVNFIDEELPE